MIKHFENYLEYSEYPEKLQKWLDSYNTNLSITIVGTIPSPFSEGHRSLLHTVVLNGYSFPFYGSHNDAIDHKKRKEWHAKKPPTLAKANTLYNVLCSIRGEYYIPEFFDEFCDEFGYDVDSIKSQDTHRDCLKHSRNLRRVLNEKIIECLPS